MKRNKISFAPFNIEEITNSQGAVVGLSAQNEDLMQLVAGISERKGLFKIFKEKSYDQLTSALSEYRKVQYPTAQNKLLVQFYDATQQLLTKNLF